MGFAGSVLALTAPSIPTVLAGSRLGLTTPSVAAALGSVLGRTPLSVPKVLVESAIILPRESRVSDLKVAEVLSGRARLSTVGRGPSTGATVALVPASGNPPVVRPP